MNTTTDDDFVKALDELVFQLKYWNNPLAFEFRKIVWQFIDNHHLDEDPEAFASLPKDYYYHKGPCVHPLL